MIQCSSEVRPKEERYPTLGSAQGETKDTCRRTLSARALECYDNFLVVSRRYLAEVEVWAGAGGLFGSVFRLGFMVSPSNANRQISFLQHVRALHYVVEMRRACCAYGICPI